MNAQKLLRRWKRRCAKLAEDIRGLAGQCQAAGSAEQLHKLRVASRRLRLYVRVGPRVLKEAVGSELRRWAKSAAQATGPVRDCDVTLEWLRRNPDTAALASQLEARRDRLWQQRKVRLTAFPAIVSAGIEEAGKKRGSADRLARQLTKREAQLRRGVREQSPLFFELAPAEQHEFRRLVRWWRYLRELALPKGKASADGLLKRLIRLQEALGERQNLAIAAGILRRFRPAGRTPELGRLLAGERAAWDNETKQSLRAPASKRQ